MRTPAMLLACGLAACSPSPPDVDPAHTAAVPQTASPASAPGPQDVQPLADPAAVVAAFDLLDPPLTFPSWVYSDAWYDLDCASSIPWSHAGINFLTVDAGEGCKTDASVAWQGVTTHGNDWQRQIEWRDWTDFLVSYDDFEGGFQFVGSGSWNRDNLTSNWTDPAVLETTLDAGITRIGVGSAAGISPELGWDPSLIPPSLWTFPGPHGSWVFDLYTLDSEGIGVQTTGTILVVEDERFDGAGLLSVELNLTVAPACEREMDGVFSVSGLVDGELVFDGSTACDLCAEAFVDGQPAGTVCF